MQNQKSFLLLWASSLYLTSELWCSDVSVVLPFASFDAQCFSFSSSFLGRYKGKGAVVSQSRSKRNCLVHYFAPSL